VLIVEKNPEGGGDTRYSAGSIRTYTDVAKAIDFIEAVCERTTERSVVEVFVNESGGNAEWVASLGGEIVAGPPTAALSPTCSSSCRIC